MGENNIALDKKHSFTLERILGEYRKKESDPLDVIKRIHIGNKFRTNPSNLTPNELIEVISILDELYYSSKLSKELIIELKIDISEVMKERKIVLIEKKVNSENNGYKTISKHKTALS